jgi:hypothetical protein
MFCAPQEIWKTPDQVLVQKMFIGTDKISEIVNDLDSDGSFSELSDSDTCTVEYILITRNKKFVFNNHTHEHVTQVFYAGYWSLRTIIHTPSAVSV